MSNLVYIATSMDGRIAGPNGEIDWLECVPVPEGDDLGFGDFMARVDAVVMGRVTFETLIGFGVGWHYGKPGLILSTTMNEAPEPFRDHVHFAQGAPAQIVEQARRLGYEHLYIDGGETIQRFLAEDLIDELIVSELPVVLGGGPRLFGSLTDPLAFELVETELLARQIVKKRHRRRA